MAHGMWRNAPRGDTLQPTALIHEAYLRMVDQSQAEWADRAHFFAYASRAMRAVLADAPEDPAILSALGNILRAQGRLEEAADLQLRVDASNPALLMADLGAAPDRLLVGIGDGTVGGTLKATLPELARLPPPLLKCIRRLETVRVGLSVAVSTRTATPWGA